MLLIAFWSQVSFLAGGSSGSTNEASFCKYNQKKDEINRYTIELHLFKYLSVETDQIQFVEHFVECL